jgi:hypothetical protein
VRHFVLIAWLPLGAPFLLASGFTALGWLLVVVSRLRPVDPAAE